MFSTNDSNRRVVSVSRSHEDYRVEVRRHN